MFIPGNSSAKALLVRTVLGLVETLFLVGLQVDKGEVCSAIIAIFMVNQILVYNYTCFGNIEINDLTLGYVYWDKFSPTSQILSVKCHVPVI